MSKFKKFFPFIAFGLVIITGLVLLFFPSLISLEPFYSVGIIVIGVIGFSLFGFITIANKKQARREEAKLQQEKLNAYNAQQQIYNSIYSAVSNAQEDAKPKKISCRFCNFIYTESAGKCPNCGAPPDKAS